MIDHRFDRQRFLVSNTDYGECYELHHAVRGEPRTKTMQAEPATFVERELAHALPNEPFLKLNKDGCIDLINQLWLAGIRPSKEIREPIEHDHLESEIKWLRGTADHLMKKPIEVKK